MFHVLVEYTSRGLLSENASMELAENADRVPSDLSNKLWSQMGILERGYLAALGREGMWSKFYEHCPDGIGRGAWRNLYHELRTQAVDAVTERTAPDADYVPAYGVMALAGTRLVGKLAVPPAAYERLVSRAVAEHRPSFDFVALAVNEDLTEQELDNLYAAFRLHISEGTLAGALVEFSEAVTRLYHEDEKELDKDTSGAVTPEEWHQDKIYLTLRADDYAGGTKMMSDMVRDIVRRQEMAWTLDDVRKVLGKYAGNRMYEPVLRQLQKLGAMDRIGKSPMAPMELFVIKLLYNYGRKLKSDPEADPFNTFSDVTKLPSPEDKWPSADPNRDPRTGDRPNDQEGERPVKGYSEPNEEDDGGEMKSRIPTGRKRRRRQIKSLQVVSMPPSMSR